MELTIRAATEDDAQFVHDVYGYYVANTTATFSITNPDVDAYREKIRHTMDLYPFYIAEADGKPCGFAYGSQIRPHDAYRWDVESTIYLSPDAPKRCGIGTALYNRFNETLASQGFKTVYGVITDQNEPSLAMHRRMGFTQAGHFRNMGFKEGKWLGVVWMQLDLGAFDKSPAEPIPFREWLKRA